MVKSIFYTNGLSDVFAFHALGGLCQQCPHFTQLVIHVAKACSRLSMIQLLSKEISPP